MSQSTQLLNLFDLKQFDQDENGLGLIKKLMDYGLFPKEKKCIRGLDMKLVSDNSVIDNFQWICRNVSNDPRHKKRCGYSASIRKDTFIAKSHLSLLEICGFINLWTMNCPSFIIQNQLRLALITVTDWNSFCREVTYDAMVLKKKKLGGIHKIIKIDESKFGKRKYHRGHRVEGQWVFGGIERETGDCFLIPVENRSTATFLVIIRDWIEPGTTIISDCWKAYDCLENEGYKHLKVNHSIHFKDPEKGAHTNGIESTWRHAKVSMPNYRRQKEFYGGYLAKYLFIKRCRTMKKDPFVEFFRDTGMLYSPDEYNFDYETNEDRCRSRCRRN